jgi:hypothetical protein
VASSAASPARRTGIESVNTARVQVVGCLCGFSVGGFFFLVQSTLRALQITTEGGVHYYRDTCNILKVLSTRRTRTLQGSKTQAEETRA